MRAANAKDPTYMGEQKIKTSFRGGMFSLKNFLFDYVSMIPKEILVYLQDVETFSRVEKEIQSFEIDMIRWLWGDGRPSDEDVYAISLYSGEEFAEEAKRTEDHLLEVINGPFSNMMFFDEQLNLFAENDGWKENIGSLFFRSVLESVSINAMQIKRKYSYKLYRDFMREISEYIVAINPKSGIDAFIQISTGGLVHTKDIRALHPEWEWAERCYMEANNIKLARDTMYEFAEWDIRKIIAALDRDEFKKKLHEFAANHTGPKWEKYVSTVAAIAYAAL